MMVSSATSSPSVAVKVTATLVSPSLEGNLRVNTSPSFTAYLLGDTETATSS